MNTHTVNGMPLLLVRHGVTWRAIDWCVFAMVAVSDREAHATTTGELNRTTDGGVTSTQI